MSSIASRRLAALAAAALAASVLPALGLAGADAATHATTVVRGSDYRAPASRFDPSSKRAHIDPSRYNAFDVDLAQVRAALSQAPTAESRGGLSFRLPTPDGGYETFAMRRSQVMQSKLAAAHPEIRTYLGRSLEHPGTTIALDLTQMGLHAQVRGPSGQGTWYVDPAYDKPGTKLHLAYYGSSVTTSPAHEMAETEAPAIAAAMSARASHTGGRTAPGAVVHQRLYRLALTSDPAYAKYFGSANVLAEKVTLINRVNQIYNDDMAIGLRLVNGTDKLNLDTEAKATGAFGPCGAHPCFDPPDPGDPTTTDDDVPGQLDFCDVPTLGRNRTVLGQLIGASNYDIGHIVLGVDGGGIAELGVVGQDYKGGGCTGLPQPQGDFFAIDYVAHEMGHEFDANHTFNGNESNCGGGNRNGPTSVEPGSGSSVMAYAGICRQDNLQPHSDPYFSERSQTEILGYTGHTIPKVAEVQTASLRGFTTNGDQITLSMPGSTHAPITLTRGTTYSAAGIKSAVQALSGKTVTVAGWGYDPFNSPTLAPAPLTIPDNTGFQVIFSPSPDPTKAPADSINEPSLKITSTTAGVTAFVGETARGGPAFNRGYRSVTTINHAPRVHAPASKTIPLRTPFKLTGSGTDAEHQKLTYLWEQNDVGAGTSATAGTVLVDNHKVTGPLFRVFGTYAKVSNASTLMTQSPGENLATGSATRYFPDLAQVLADNTNALTGTCPKVPLLPAGSDNYHPVKTGVINCYSEFLPTKGYIGNAGSEGHAMHFRLTARDGFPNGGGSSFDDVTLRISQTAGPFLVTSQAKKTAKIKGGTSKLVTWKVNGTKPLAARVGILLSLNGGKTFTKVLANSTPNDGSQLVRFPASKTGKARIMIVARGNYFFAVNRAPFTID